MFRIIGLFVVACLFSSAVSAQGFRLNAYGNYVFDDKVDSYYSGTNYFNGTIKGGFQWGAGLEFRLKEYYGLELMYMRQDTHVPVEYYDYNAVVPGVKNANLDLGINYIMLGGARTFHPSEKVEPYGGFMLGMAIIDAKNPDKGTSNSSTKFAWGLRLGANIWTSGRLGIKLQTQLLSVPQGASGGLYFGTGGAGAGVSTYSTMLQFVLGGGIAIKMGQQTPQHAK